MCKEKVNSSLICLLCTYKGLEVCKRCKGNSLFKLRTESGKSDDKVRR